MKRGTWRGPSTSRPIAVNPFKLGWDKHAVIAAASLERKALLSPTFEPVTVSEAHSVLTRVVTGQRRAFVNLVKVRASTKALGWGCRACGRTGGFITTYGLNLDDFETNAHTAETASAAFAMFVNRHNRCL